MRSTGFHLNRRSRHLVIPMALMARTSRIRNRNIVENDLHGRLQAIFCW